MISDPSWAYGLYKRMRSAGRVTHAGCCPYWEHVPCWGSIVVVTKEQIAAGEAACTCEVAELDTWMKNQSRAWKASELTCKVCGRKMIEYYPGHWNCHCGSAARRTELGMSFTRSDDGWTTEDIRTPDRAEGESYE